ncbi:hypothetical protein OAC86_00065 [bacterium]|jgi:hypothetical protein|nr:hypothetical protein [bacterium]MDB9899918.1 hypothetical protein [bacterium]|tara:strand:- start:5060 stop:5269 length:210 start_codon:yes stop_codon:yes gene_type:complete
MEEKTAKDIAVQLKRIADALVKKNTITESENKRRLKLDKLEERKLRFDIKDAGSTLNENISRTRPNLDS